MTTRAKTAIVLWALFIVGAVGLAFLATSLWFAVAAIAMVGLGYWMRHLRAGTAEQRS